MEKLIAQDIWVETNEASDTELMTYGIHKCLVKPIASQFVFSKEELKELLVMVYTAADIHGIATANGRLDKVLSPKDYFKKNFNIDL